MLTGSTGDCGKVSQYVGLMFAKQICHHHVYDGERAGRTRVHTHMSMHMLGAGERVTELSNYTHYQKPEVDPGQTA